MRSLNTPLQVTVPNYRESLSGVVLTAMALGALVEYKAGNAADAARELIAANGGFPAILEQEVMTDVNWQAHCKLDPQFSPEIRKPVPVGSAVSARFAHEIEVEGATFFHDVDTNTAAGTPLKTENGQFAIATPGTHRIIGYLTRKVTPYDSTSFRWVIELVG